MKLFKIAFANIKKRKSSALTFFTIIMMSTIMLSIALFLLLNINSFYEKKRQELNSSDIFIVIPQNDWNDEMIDYVANYNKITDYQNGNGYFAELKHYKDKTQKWRSQFLICDSKDINETSINKVAIIDELKLKPTSYVYLPLAFKYSGYNSGDKFFLDSANEIYEFTICGFFEDTLIGASTMGVKSIFIDSHTYERIADDGTFFLANKIAIIFEEIEMSYQFQTEFQAKFQMRAGFILHYESAKLAHTMFALVMSYILIIVSSIVLIIALVIVRFNINNSIDEDMKSLGALKSIGFTSKQIVLSILMQFIFIAFLGCIIGVLISGLSAKFVGNIVTATSGLLWSSTSFFTPALIAILAICGITSLTVFLAARKSNIITPIVALRSGIKTHSFNKNHAPFDKVRIPFNLSLAIKTFFGSLKSFITAFIVTSLFGFITVFCFTLYNNFVLDTKAFVQMLGLEPSQVQVGVFEETNALAIFDEINRLDGVTKMVRFGDFSTIVENKTLYITVWEDINQKERNSLVEGRYPIYDNEITLVSSAQAILNKNIGDVINIEFAGVKTSFLIVGITQGASGDVKSDMTLGGFKRLKYDVVLNAAYIYLQQSDSEYVDNFINKLRIKYESQISAINLNEVLDSTLIGIKNPVRTAILLIFLIGIITIIFVFFLLVRTIIRRKNKDLGIMKAIGFTTKQLTFQILLSFLPSIVFGLILGSVIGVLLSNPILGLMLNGIGIAKAIFVIPFAITAIVQLTLLLVCISTIMLVSLKIKRITPQKLIIE